MRKQTLLASTSRRGYRPSIRLGKHGHPMRDPDGHEGGESHGGGDNAGGNGGNSGQSGGNAGNQGNNGGDAFDAGSFWNSPAEETPASGNGGSAGGSNQQGTGNQNQGGGDDGGNAFANALNGLKFGDGVFTPDAVSAMNDGDPSKFNGNMESFGREVTRQAVIMAAQLMQKNNGSMESKFQQMMEEKFGTRDTESNLAQEIPSYTKPGMKPIIDGIMAQALRLSKGDRKAAIGMTKEMLKFQTQQLGSDFGITTPPGGSGNDFGTGQTTDWAEELLGR